MLNTKALLTKLKQATKAECVGLIQLSPELKEIDFLDESKLDFLKTIAFEQLSGFCMDMMGNQTCNTTIQIKDKTVFLKIVRGTYVLYAISKNKDFNVSKYYSTMTLLSSEL